MKHNNQRFWFVFTIFHTLICKRLTVYCRVFHVKIVHCTKRTIITNVFRAIVLPSSLCVEHYRILVDLCNYRIKTAFKPTGLDFDRGTENKSYFRLVMP